MDQDRIISDLQEERENIKTQIESLEADLEAVNRLLRRLTSKRGQLDSAVTVSSPSSLKPLPATKFIINQLPNKTWIPTELRDRLVEMRKRGELDSKTQELLPVSHRLLKALERQGFVRAIKNKKGNFKKVT